MLTLLLATAFAQTADLQVDTDTRELAVELYAEEDFLVEERDTGERVASEEAYVCVEAVARPCLVTDDRTCTEVTALQAHDDQWCGFVGDIAMFARNRIGLERDEAERAKIRWEKRQN